MWKANELEVEKVLKRLQTASGVEIPGQRIAAKNLGHLQVQEMGSMKCLAWDEKTFGNSGTIRRPEQNLEHRRSVNNDHRRSRSDLTALAGGTRGVTAVRWASR